eukprot:4165514-Amphidinium_carterae.1
MKPEFQQNKTQVIVTLCAWAIGQIIFKKEFNRESSSSWTTAAQLANCKWTSMERQRNLRRTSSG